MSSSTQEDSIKNSKKSVVNETLVKEKLINFVSSEQDVFTKEKTFTKISPTKMQLPTVEFNWHNVWYYLRGESYIRGVETRLSFEKNENHDYVRFQKQAAQWIVDTGARDWNSGYRSIFLQEIAVDVLLSAQEHKLYPSVIFAQSILESGWGRSRLAQKYNNLFGIKGYSPDLKVRTTTYEKI